MATLPPAGWYDDPEYPDHLRYWGGESWSEHRSPKAAATKSAAASGLSDIGDWLNQSFRVLWERRVQMLAVFGLNVVASLLYAVLVVRLWDDLVWDGETWSGFSAGRVWATIALTLVLGLVNGLLYLVACHQLYHSRLGLQPPFVTSLRVALRALPRAIGWLLALAGAAIVAIFVVAVLITLNVLLGIASILALAVGAVWAFVKLAFLAPALVIPIDGRNAVKASADVSRSRFWPVFGRLALLLVITFGMSVGLSLITAPFTATDSDAVEEYVVVVDDELVRLDVAGMIDEMNLAGPASILATLPGLVTTLVSLSAASVIFAETYQVRPHEPTATDGHDSSV